MTNTLFRGEAYATAPVTHTAPLSRPQSSSVALPWRDELLTTAQTKAALLHNDSRSLQHPTCTAQQHNTKTSTQQR